MVSSVWLTGDQDVVRAMDIAFRYRNYFRKVCLLPCYGKCNPYQADDGRTSSWIFWSIDDGVFISSFFFSYLWLTHLLKGVRFQTATSSFSEHCIYRHNELDLPGITSPLMYEKIAARQSVPQLYEAKLIVRLLSPSFPFLAPPNALNSTRKKT